MKRPDWFLLGLLGAVLLAWLLPEPGARGGSLHPELTNKLGVALIFFLHGLTLAFSALVAGVRKWRLHALVQSTTFLFFPLLGLGLLSSLGPRLEPDLRTGVFFLCALPSTVSSSIALTAAARGNVAAALFNATLSSLLGVLLTPLWLSIALGTSEQALPLGPVVAELVRWLVLPLVVGQVLRPWLGGWADRHRARLSVVDRVTILLLVYTSFCDSVQAGVWKSGLTTLAIVSVLCCLLLVVALVATWFAGKALGFDDSDRIATLFCGSKKSLAAGVPMAALIFGAGPRLALVLLPILVYHSIQLLVGGWIAGRLAERS
jgi:solute carrier family 10 (sodium/bile acid cotransporter), member 7